MALTSSGWVAERFQEIVKELSDALRNNIDQSLDTSSTSVAGQINSIFAAEIASLEDLGQAIYDSGNKDKAEGKNLDDLAALIGVTRISASPTNGRIALTGATATVVPRNSIFTHKFSGERFLLQNDTTLSSASCTNVQYTVASVLASTAYTIVINNTNYTYTSSGSPSVASIIQGLESVIALSSDPSFTVINGSNTKLILQATNPVNPIIVTATSYLSVASVTSLGTVIAENDGPVSAVADTVNIISTPALGLVSATNPVDLSVGRNNESDEELRERMSISVQVAGKATVPAIEAALRNLSGVSLARVIENTSIYSDPAGRPGKSFEAVVVGGNDQDIGDTLWDVKPAGIETFGNVTIVVVDANNNEQAVKFSRPVNQYIHVQVTYSLYDEESFPSTGEATIKQAIADYGSTLGVGVDAIAKRFYGKVYSSVSGIKDLNISFGVTEAADKTPSSYEAVIPIGNVQIADFDIVRVSVTLI